MVCKKQFSLKAYGVPIWRYHFDNLPQFGLLPELTDKWHLSHIIFDFIGNCTKASRLHTNQKKNGRRCSSL